jgi:hypothetical protein
VFSAAAVPAGVTREARAVRAAKILCRMVRPCYHLRGHVAENAMDRPSAPKRPSSLEIQ